MRCSYVTSAPCFVCQHAFVTALCAVVRQRLRACPRAWQRAVHTSRTSTYLVPYTSQHRGQFRWSCPASWPATARAWLGQSCAGWLLLESNSSSITNTRHRNAHAVGGAGAIFVRLGLSMVQLGLEVRQELLVPAQPLRQMVSGHQVVRASRQGPRRHVAYRP